MILFISVMWFYTTKEDLSIEHAHFAEGGAHNEDT